MALGPNKTPVWANISKDMKKRLKAIHKKHPQHPSESAIIVAALEMYVPIIETKMRRGGASLEL
jgi:hypothetical protein